MIHEQRFEEHLIPIDRDLMQNADFMIRTGFRTVEILHKDSALAHFSAGKRVPDVPGTL